MTSTARTRRRRGRLTRRIALLPVLAGLLLALPAQPVSAVEATPADPLTAAQTQAVSTGKTVPVDALTTEASTTDALPDGTFENTTSVLPVRVRKDDAWVPVDATLVADGNGGFAPKATPNAVTLSGGGSSPLVTLTHADGPSMSLTLPFTLPAPAVSGDTALYTSVLPGVDLSVSVTDQGGFSEVLIVHDATAAANPELKKLTLAADTDGLALATTPDGGMDATATGGTLAYTSPEPLMWDSAPSTVPAMLQAPSAAPAATAGPVTTAVQESSVDGPGINATVEPVAMTANNSALTLTPDAALLTGPDTTYPVFIDPYTNPVTSTAGHFTEVYSSSTCDNSPQYDKAQTNGQGVGYQRWGGACGTGLERSYWAVNTGGLHSSFVVYDAFVKVSTTYAASWDCSQNQPLTLHTVNAISSSTDWLSRPGTHDTAFPPATDTVPSGANSGSSCSNTTATFHVTAGAQKIADAEGDGYDAGGTFGAGTNTWTFGLYGNESISSSNDDYLRMSTTLTLTTRFDIPPAVPTSLHTTPAATGAAAACTTSGVGWIGATTYSDAGSNIKLHSTVTTQMSGENVRAHYYVWDRTVDPDGDGNGASMSTPDSAFLNPGTDAVMNIGFTLKDGHQYGWDVYAEDDSSQSLTSPKSDHCWFNTDFTAPQTPDVANNPSFPPVGSGPVDPDKIIYAGAGKTTTFSIADVDNPAADTSCDPGPCKSSGMDHFLWRLDSPPTAADATSADVTGTDSQGRSTATLTVPITDWGVHTLYVAGVDKADNISTSPTAYTYTVPWNPATTVKPGDISGDGVPDLLATTKTGDLDLIPGNFDPAQDTDPAQTGPVTGTPPAVTGPVTVSAAADSPNGTGWNNYLIAHRGNSHGAAVDDLFAYNKATGQLYIVKNDLDPADDAAFPPTAYSTYGGYIGRRFDVIVKDECADSTVLPDDTRCRTTDYNSKTWNISQLITPGNVFANRQGHPAVITVENKELWIYQPDGVKLKNPILLGDGDWTGQTLIAAGTLEGAPVLWSRDNTTGALYSYPITVDSTAKAPPLLHPTVHTNLGLTLPPASYPVIASPGDVNSLVQDATAGGPDGIPDLYTVDTSGQLIEYPYRQSTGATTPPTYAFAPPVSLGSVSDTATHWWKLAEGTGATTADSTGTLGATLSGAYSWATDTSRGKVLSLTGTTGYAAATGPALDTSKSYTVSAWVKLNSLAVNSTFISQPGATNYGPGLQLYYSSGDQVWAFGRRSADVAGGPWRAAYGSKATTGQWTHLVGVYDAPAQELRLYVNGKLTGTQAWTYTPWNATGPLQIGRTVSGGGYVEYANASISNIRLYPTALPPADAAATGDTPKAVQLD